MHKKSTTRISIFLISILFSLFLFSCADSDDSGSGSSIENENKTNDVETPSYYAMIGTWINPEDNSDTITISEDTVTLSVTATKKYESENYDKPYELKITEAETVNEEFIQSLKDEIIKLGNDWANVKKNDTEYYTWLEKTDIEFSNNLTYFQKEPSLFFGRFAYIYLWLDNEELNIRYIKHFNNELHGTEYKYIKKGSGSQNNPSDVIDLTGSYTISEANGSTFKFSSDGTWTYNYNSRTTNGTWSVSDGELTITYSLGGYSSSAVFTVKVSNNTYTLTGKSGDTTTIISSAFKITDKNAVQNGVVTLVKK